MTIDEAINILKQYVDYDNPDVPDFYTMEEAIKVIIEALEQEPCDDVPDINDGNIKELEVLDKIRADIQKLRGCSCSCSDGIIDDVEDILDKYKAESEGEE
jgi:hypothetical protein